VTLEEMLLFSRQMYTLLKSGVPILKALATLQESAGRIGFANMLRDLRESLDSGRDLSTAMRRHPGVFGPFYLSMVRVGELTGALEEIFLRLFSHIEFEKEIKEKVSEALRYPMFVIVVMAVALIVVNIFVIPAFARIFAGFRAELPFMTKLLLGFSEFMVQYWPALLGLAAGAYIAFRIWIGTPAGRYSWDRMKLRIPIAGKIVLKATLARFARSLSIALKSGVPIVQGLSVVEQVVDN
jgi:MSHA biogenesis protein MshG